MEKPTGNSVFAEQPKFTAIPMDPYTIFVYHADARGEKFVLGLVNKEKFLTNLVPQGMNFYLGIINKCYDNKEVIDYINAFNDEPEVESEPKINKEKEG